MSKEKTPPVVDSAITAALATIGRPARDRARDQRDHTAELLAFAAVQPGEVVADFLPFRGYFTRLFSNLVSPDGRVYAVIPKSLTRIDRIKQGGAEIAAFAPQYPNLRLLEGATERAGEPPEPIDLFWLSQNYHDLHDPFMGPVAIGAFNAAVFASLRPGGRLIIVDHVAAGDADQDVTDTKHRISPAVVRAEVEAAGFRWDGHCDALANPADEHRKSIFAHGVRYHTDRFIHRYRKPG